MLNRQLRKHKVWMLKLRIFPANQLQGRACEAEIVYAWFSLSWRRTKSGICSLRHRTTSWKCTSLLTQEGMAVRNKIHIERNTCNLSQQSSRWAVQHASDICKANQIIVFASFCKSSSPILSLFSLSLPPSLSCVHAWVRACAHMTSGLIYSNSNTVSVIAFHDFLFALCAIIILLFQYLCTY